MNKRIKCSFLYACKSFFYLLPRVSLKKEMIMTLKTLIVSLSFFCFLGIAESTPPAENPSQIITVQKAVKTPAMKKTTTQKTKVEITQQTETATVSTEKETASQNTPAVHQKIDKQTEPKSEVFLERKLSTTNMAGNSRFLEFGLEYPINFGIHLRYLINDDIYARMGFGFMPSFFLDTFKKLSPSFGYLNEEEAKLISDTFENSMYIEFRLVWSPYLKEASGGPYLEIGLSRMLYGKGELKGIDLNKVIEQNSFDELTNYSAKTNTYNATAHIGYQIPFEKVRLNLEVGLIKILHTKILSETSLESQLLDDNQQKIFTDFLKEKGWIFPTVSGWISFAF